jgi:hypothetical protein
VSLVAGGGQCPTPAIAEAGGSAPKRAGGSVLPSLRRQTEAEQPPELAGSKHAAPEQGLSGRLVKKPWVHSKV